MLDVMVRLSPLALVPFEEVVEEGRVLTDDYRNKAAKP